MIESLTEPGIYLRARQGVEAEPILAANMVRDESDLRIATPTQITEWTRFRKLVIAQDPQELERLIKEFREGRSLTEIFFWLVLLLALVEWWYANRVLRQKAGAIEKMRVGLSGKVVIS
jgi:hypothetical protein